LANGCVYCANQCATTLAGYVAISSCNATECECAVYAAIGAANLTTCANCLQPIADGGDADIIIEFAQACGVIPPSSSPVSSTYGSSASLALTSAALASDSASSTGAVASSTSATVTMTLNNDSYTGALAGGIIGGIALIGLIFAGMYYVYQQGKRSGLRGASPGGTSGEPKLTDPTMASGNLGQEARNSLDGGNFASGANPEVEPASHAIRYLDEERLGTASA